MARNRFIEFNGSTRCVGEWSEITGIEPSLLFARIDRLGWSVAKALTIPVGSIKKGPNKNRDYLLD